MFSHLFVGGNDLAKSKVFYDAIFGALGAKPGVHDAAKGRIMYAHGGSAFFVATPIDGKQATAANGGTIGFAMTSPEQVKAWHDAGVAAGGKSIEDPPGPRGQLYLAYLSDPDGNKLCGLHRMPAA